MKPVKLSVFDVIIYTLFLASVFLFSMAKAQMEYHYFFLLFCFILFLVKPDYVLFLYIIILPTNGIIGRDYFLISTLGIKQIVSIFALIVLFKIPNHKNEPRADQLLRSINLFVIIFIAYGVYTGFKNAYYGLQGYDYQYALFRSGNIIIMNTPLIYLIKKIQIPKVTETVGKAIVFGILNMIFFAILSPLLPDFGIKSIGTEITEFEDSSFSRFTGVIADGDSNTLGVFMVLCIGFILNQFKFYSKYLSYVIISLALICIALSGSRTAFISLIAIVMIFFVRDGNTKLKMQFFFFFIVLIIVSLPLWEMTLERLALSDKQLDTNSESNRIGKWILYMNFILKNPQTFITGTNTELKIGWGDVFFSVHNVYIQVLYNAGLLFVYAILLSYYKLIRAWNSLGIQQKIAYIFIPFFSITMVVSDMGIIYYTVLFFALIPAQQHLLTKIKLQQNQLHAQ